MLPPLFPPVGPHEGPTNPPPLPEGDETFGFKGVGEDQFVFPGAVGEFFGFTVKLGFTSSVEPSGYVTTTVTGRVPGVVVSGLSLKAKVVFGGRSFSFVIISSGVSGDHLSIVLSSQVGAKCSASDKMVKFAVTSSCELSG